jgi:hypothetical protein
MFTRLREEDVKRFLLGSGVQYTTLGYAKKM